MEFELIEWDEANLDHATRRASRLEIEQALRNANQMLPHPDADRRVVRSVTDGGRRLVVIVELLGRDRVRPITAWRDR